MPNHVTTRLTFYGNQEDVKRLFETIGVEKSAIDFNKIIPMPDYIYQGDLGQEERKIYGKNNWYDWCCDNWGTKWNAYNISVDENSITFDTAWTTPTPIVNRLAELFPEITIIHEWADEDSGHNTGRRVLKGEFIVGGYYENESNAAYKMYLKLKGDSDCIGQDQDGNYIHYICETCPNKDKC